MYLARNKAIHGPRVGANERRIKKRTKLNRFNENLEDIAKAYGFNRVMQLHPTKGWRSYSRKRLDAQFRMASMFGGPPRT